MLDGSDEAGENVAAVATQTAVHPHKVDRDDLSLLDLVVFGICGLAGVAVVLLAAFAVYPFAGIIAAYVLGYLLEGAAHGLAVSLLVAAVNEARHPTWTFLGTGEYILMAVVTLALLVGLFVQDRWVVHVGLGTAATWGYFISAGVVSVVMAVLTYLTMRPGGFEGQTESMSIHVLAGLVGLALGAGLMAGVIGVLAWYRQANLPKASIAIPVVHGISGRYMALGDSYSAGEGLAPFDPGTGAVAQGGNGCDRSRGAYSQLLVFDPAPAGVQFPACSGAVIPDIYTAFHKYATGRPPTTVGPQVDGAVHPDVGLVTLTIGGNDALFSDIVQICFSSPNCMKTLFVTPGHLFERPTLTWPPSQRLETWGPAAVQIVSQRAATLYGKLRQSYPNARIVAIGYPYLFPGGRAGLQPNDCASILRRYSLVERTGIRALSDQFNNALYEQAVAARIEFVSPVAVWAGHEPCGTKGQYVNSIKPILNVSRPVDGGSFHPTGDGQRQLAALVACYLDLNRQPPNAFVGGPPRPLTVSGIAEPSALGLVAAPGSKGAPLSCAGVG
ncbi:MAG: hypothetical protein QOD49_2236 [Actinomycetota bacterium]|nr:hypothetical protein [Actinomycetota bacterium]